MALLHIDGFDCYNKTADMVNVGYILSEANLGTGGRFSTSKKKIVSNAAGYVRKKIGANITTIFTGFAFYCSTAVNWDSNIFQLLDSAQADQIVFGHNTNGTIYVKRGTTLLGTSTISLQADTWYYIAIKAIIADSGGAVEVWINGVKDIDVSGVDTKNTTNVGVDYVSYITAYTYGRIHHFDDVYTADDSGSVNNTLITEARVVSIEPSADTAQKDFTASTGSDNYAMVNEDYQDGDTTYVSSSVNEAKDIYDLENLPADINTVYGVSTFAVARKDDTDAVTLDFGIKSGSTESFSTGNVMATGYIGFETIDNVDPDTSGAWSVSAVNALQCGFATTI